MPFIKQYHLPFFVKTRFMLLILCLILGSKVATAATTKQDSIAKPLYQNVYRNHLFTLGVFTDGWGFSYEYEFGKNRVSKKILGIEFTERKHPKESKVSLHSDVYGNFSLAYGKQNIAYPLNFYFGKIIELGRPNQEKGLSINVFYRGGLSLALIRPYYITIIDTSIQFDPDKNLHIKYSTRDSLYFFNKDYFKNSPVFLGWNELNVIPGINMGGGIDFEFGHLFSQNTLIGFRANCNVEWYLHKLEIMVPKPNLINNNFFINGKLSIYIGFQTTKNKPLKQY